jgi:hypothetical protein
MTHRQAAVQSAFGRQPAAAPVQSAGGYVDASAGAAPSPPSIAGEPPVASSRNT